MENTHILNGDALSAKLPSSIPGKKIVFRECLVDGPVDFDSFEGLILGRSEYLTKTYPGAQEEPYIPHVSEELEKIITCSDSGRVYCWFEADLFCQVNLWYSIFLLNDHKGEIVLVLPEMTLENGFADLNEDELLEAYREPRVLSKNERSILSRLWVLFQKNKSEEAKRLAWTLETELPFLMPAVQAWEDSIPKGDNPGKPKAELKAIAEKLETEEFKYIFREFKRRLPIYGYGDLITRRLWEEVQKENSDN
jgi:hypothetical protein